MRALVLAGAKGLDDALWVALAHGNEPAWRTLLALGAKPIVPEGRDASELKTQVAAGAIKWGGCSSLAQLLEWGADPNGRAHLFANLVTYAAERQQPDCIALLLARGGWSTTRSSTPRTTRISAA